MLYWHADTLKMMRPRFAKMPHDVTTLDELPAPITPCTMAISDERYARAMRCAAHERAMIRYLYEREREAMMPLPRVEACRRCCATCRCRFDAMLLLLAADTPPFFLPPLMPAHAATTLLMLFCHAAAMMPR